ncbi:MAG: tRNA (adenosine(37)-N6)-threonylcarbamoyltransferase complex dimerization subunit type 1 TsaB [Flavobacteriales bacterium]
MTVILQLETATRTCSVALSLNGETLALKESTDAEYTHSEKLFSYIQTIMLENKKTMCELSAVAVSSGPGSYTGLRIGVSAAKGICTGLSIPLIGIETSYLLAVAAKKQFPHADYFIPMIDARRMEVYSALYSGQLELIEKVKPKVLDENFYSQIDVNSKIIFCGDGVEKYKSVSIFKNAVYLTDAVPSSANMSSEAFRKLQQNLTEDVAYFEPNYLKEFVTQAKFQ